MNPETTFLMAYIFACAVILGGLVAGFEIVYYLYKTRVERMTRLDWRNDWKDR